MVTTEKSMKKDILVLIFRYIIAIGLFIFFYNKAKDIDFSKLWVISPLKLLYFFTIRFLIYLTIAYRLFLLLNKNKNESSFLRVFLVNKIGLLISYVLPSAVFSDLSKIYFLKTASQKKTKILITVFIDRVIGLFCVLFLLMSSSFLLGIFDADLVYRAVYQSKWFNYVMTLFVVSALIVSAAAYYKVSVLKTWIKENIGFLSFAVMFRAFVLTVIGHLAYSFLVFEINREIKLVDMSYVQSNVAFSMASLGTMLPTTPGSVGVGQALYKYLVDFLTASNTSSGILIFTLLQLMDIPFLVLGVVAPLLLNWKRGKKLKFKFL